MNPAFFAQLTYVRILRTDGLVSVSVVFSYLFGERSTESCPQNDAAPLIEGIGSLRLWFVWLSHGVQQQLLW